MQSPQSQLLIDNELGLRSGMKHCNLHQHQNLSTECDYVMHGVYTYVLAAPYLAPTSRTWWSSCSLRFAQSLGWSMILSDWRSSLRKIEETNEFFFFFIFPVCISQRGSSGKEKLAHTHTYLVQTGTLLLLSTQRTARASLYPFRHCNFIKGQFNGWTRSRAEPRVVDQELRCHDKRCSAVESTTLISAYEECRRSTWSLQAANRVTKLKLAGAAAAHMWLSHSESVKTSFNVPRARVVPIWRLATRDFSLRTTALNCCGNLGCFCLCNNLSLPTSSSS